MTGFVGILNNPATSQNSHSAGWNDLVRLSIDPYANFLTEEDNWDDYDRLIINHGPNFKPGSYNIIGGIGAEVYKRINKLILCDIYGCEILTYDGFQMNDFVKKRKLESAWTEEIPKIEIPFKPEGETLIGDSHAISVWPDKSWNIKRMDGKTLYSFLKDPTCADYFYFGNIDVRFHLPRQENPHQATEQLVARYVEFAKKCGAKVSHLLPVESEDRKLPGTGLYKGQKFFGSQQLRQSIVELFNRRLDQSGLRVHRWPTLWYRDLEFYEKEVMEPRQSVHIRPKHYVTDKS